MNFINFKEHYYPEYQAKGNAAQWIMPFAKEWCKGQGYDIGCNREEWAYPGAKMIDITIDDEYDAYHLPDQQVDYIFSSHCLEHLPDWVGALEYWATKIKSGGVLFLYLPHESQKYWHPLNNRKHLHSFNESMFKEYLNQNWWCRIKWSHDSIITGSDLNNSFCVVLIKS
ncbi:Methyltransferase domain protein [compost metagenome]